MTDKILHKRSFTSGSIPTTSSLLIGEIALNVPDGKIYIHKSGSQGKSIESAITSNSTASIGILTLSGSLILSGSTAVNSGSILDIATDNISFDFDSLAFSGSAQITGSLLVTTGITGSLFGTSSWANNAVTASYVLNAISSSFATTASYAVNASTPSGPWGISNASGSYTYYSSLSASMAAASAGQVVEMFANVTASAVVMIKPNITIQGNGYTYTYSGSTGDVFVTPPGAGTYTYYFNNININRANTATSTGAIFAGDGTGYTTALVFKCAATRVTYTTTTGTAPIFRSTGFGIFGCTFDGIDIIGNTSGYLIDTSFAVNNVKNSRLENTGTGGCITTANISGNCFHENNYIKTNSGNGIFCNYAGDTVKNCIVISNSGNAIAGQSGATAYNCFAFSNTGKAFAGMVCYGCTGQTTTGNAYYQGSAYNSSGRSTTGNTVIPFSGMSNFYNSSFYSSGNITVYSTDYGASFYNCSIITDYNNAAGHAISIGPSSGNPSFVNNYIQVANTSANCIKSTPASFSAAITGNVYKGATTPVNTNVTQTITNTKDNQGNIII